MRKTITSQIEETAFQLLEEHKDGIRWTDLNKSIKVIHPTFHPKTINGTVWKLIEKYPEKIYKSSKGLFRLLKYTNEEEI